MTVLVKNKPSLTIPQAIAKKAGFKSGDMIEFKVTRGTVTVRTTTFPTADDEYTPEQRRALDAILAKAEKGPYYGPFKNGAEIAAFMKKRQRSQKSAKLKTLLDEHSPLAAGHRAVGSRSSAGPKSLHQANRLSGPKPAPSRPAREEV